MQELGEEPLDQVLFAVKALAEAQFSSPVSLGRDVRRGALVLDQFADAIGIVSLVREHDGARGEVVEQRVGDLPVVRLPCGQAEPEREALRVDNDVDFGREPASAATETMIWTLLFCRRSLLVRPDRGTVDHLDVAVVRCADGVHQSVPYARLPPSIEAVLAGGARAVTLRRVAPWRTRPQHPEDAVQHAPVVDARHASWFVGQQRLDHAPPEVGQMVSAHADAASKPGQEEKLARVLPLYAHRPYRTEMMEDPEQAANDAWQTTFHEAAYRFSVALKELHHSNPWPETPVLAPPINLLATELWDRCFSLTEITSAFKDAAADLPRYAADGEVRP